MKITFVQSDKEKREADRVVANGLSLRRAKTGTWILPPNLTPDGRFTVVDCPTGREVFVESFDTVDGALLYALGVKDRGSIIRYWDRHGKLKDWGNFV